MPISPWNAASELVLEEVNSGCGSGLAAAVGKKFHPPSSRLVDEPVESGERDEGTGGKELNVSMSGHAPDDEAWA